MPPLHTKLSTVLARQVPTQSRTRGFAYFTRGAVRSLTAQNGIIQATVRGSQLYDVWLEPDGELRQASCTCPYFIDQYDICKHVWAVILAAEAEAVPLLRPGVTPDEVYLEPLVPDDDDGDPKDEDERVWTPAVRAPLLAPRRERQPPPPWRVLIDTVSATAPATPGLRPRIAAGQLLYVVDVAATTASGALVIELMTRDRKANGDWGKPKPARVTAADVASLPDPAEREILQRLAGARSFLEWAGYNSFGQEICRVELRGVLVTD